MTRLNVATAAARRTPPILIVEVAHRREVYNKL
jgi:hypothetical protein